MPVIETRQQSVGNFFDVATYQAAIQGSMLELVDGFTCNLNSLRLTKPGCFACVFLRKKVATAATAPAATGKTAKK